MEDFVYRGRKTREISFPLGGIGTGCIGLSGNGRLIDWEIYNRPNKGSVNGFSHFAIKAESGNSVLDARVLNGDLHPPYTGDNTGSINYFGFGAARETLAGLPHFKDVVFKGEYPIANLDFIHDKFPGKVSLTAFNPLIPLNDKDSSIPGAFFEIQVSNTTTCDINYTICASLANPLPYGTTFNSMTCDGKISLIKLSSMNYRKDQPEYGNMALAADSHDVCYQEYWYRGAWFDNLTTFWKDFITPGRLKNRAYNTTSIGNLRGLQRFQQDICSLAVRMNVKPGDKGSARFIITWYFPNCYNYWNPEKAIINENNNSVSGIKTWKNYYTVLFEDSEASAKYGLLNWERLYNETLMFKDALFLSSMPAEARDAISANISTLKSPTVLRLEDGSFYGFEGCSSSSGMCEGSCTHVWNYAYALPFLFPELERSMRSLDYMYNMGEDGRMSFRLQLPLGREMWRFRACVDGQFGGVIKTYRDWKISGDTGWLKSVWPNVKKSLEFAWADTNEDKWDADRDGVLEGRQHHTLDMELFDPNSWLTGFYLAALKAGSEIAEFLGETEKAQEYRSLFEKGRCWVDINLFNGEYYAQLIDLKDKSLLEPFVQENSTDPDIMETYWNKEKKEIKYQVGEGCSVDQVIAQWHANICGLGDIFDREHTRQALQSIYRYNFKGSFRDFFNPCRLFSLDDEAGLIICEWPQGKYKPSIPVPYSEECLNGCEYQAASHMIQEGLVKEGMDVVKAIRARYDGEKRNPWNEFECGSNYARSMSSYTLLHAFSGFEFDMVQGMVGFSPGLLNDGYFKTFWCLNKGWGTYEQYVDRACLTVLYGVLDIKALKLSDLKRGHIKGVNLDGTDIAFINENGMVIFAQPLRIIKGSKLAVKAE